MENIEDIKRLYQEQWTLCKRIQDNEVDSNDTKVTKARIHQIWGMLDSADKVLLREAFDQMIEENKNKIESVRTSNLNETDRLLQLRDLCLQNDVLRRGQY